MQTPAAAEPAPTPAPTLTTILAAGGDAWVDVAVANLWAEPDQARPLDAPSLAKPVDIDAWLASMTIDDRLWLVGRLVTQALYGDQVTVVETAGDWAKVVVLRQPSSLDPRGYPGWLPTAQLTRPPAGHGHRRHRDRRPEPHRPAATRPTPTAPSWTLSFNTRLPVVDVDPTLGDRRRPRGRPRPAAGDRRQCAHRRHPARPGGDEVVGAPSSSPASPTCGGHLGAAWDCSGLTSAVYAAHGVVIPRDADDQAAAGGPSTGRPAPRRPALLRHRPRPRFDPPRRHLRRRRQDDPGAGHRPQGRDGVDRPARPGQRVLGRPPIYRLIVRGRPSR